MPPYAQTLTTLFALGALGMQALLLASLVYRLVRGTWAPPAVQPYIARFGLYLGALLASVAVLLSLWYSEVIGIPVCPLCWFARTMMYPLAVVLIVAAITRDREVWRYVLPISWIGVLISGYHHLYQLGVAPSGLCNALQGGGGCAQRYVFEFGYITMPLFGTTMFLMIALLTWLARTPAQGSTTPASTPIPPQVS